MSDKNNGSQKCSELAGSESGELINKRYCRGFENGGRRGRGKGRTIILGQNDVLLVSSNTLPTAYICECVYVSTLRTMLILFRLARFRLTQVVIVVAAPLASFSTGDKNAARVEEGRYYRTSAYCAEIILCKSYYSRLTALQPTVMYSGGGFMRLCRNNT